MKTQDNGTFWLALKTERQIKARLGRAVLLDHLSVTEIEQLYYIAFNHSDDQLVKALIKKKVAAKKPKRKGATVGGRA